MRSNREPDLAAFGDYDGVLQKIGDLKIRPPVRRYFQILGYVQRIRNVKWCLFALFMTLCIELQIKAWFPENTDKTAVDNVEKQALFSLVIAIGVLTLVWLLEYAVLVYGGDPSELFETRDEELAIARNIGDLVLSAEPAVRTSGHDVQTNIGALFSVHDSTSIKPQPVHSPDRSKELGGYRALGVPINDAFPRALSLPNGPPVRQPAPGTVRAGLLNFNAALGSKHHNK